MQKPAIISGNPGHDALDYRTRGTGFPGRDGSRTVCAPASSSPSCPSWFSLLICHRVSLLPLRRLRFPSLAVHRATAQHVGSDFAELCEIVEETIELYKQEGKPLPPSTSGRDYATRMLAVR